MENKGKNKYEIKQKGDEKSYVRALAFVSSSQGSIPGLGSAGIDMYVTHKSSVTFF